MLSPECGILKEFANMFCKEEFPILLTFWKASSYHRFHFLHTFGYAVIH